MRDGVGFIIARCTRTVPALFAANRIHGSRMRLGLARYTPALAQ